MAMLAVMLPAGGRQVIPGPHAAERLAELGVTHISLLRGDGVALVVLEGWAFDATGSATEVTALVAGDRIEAQTLAAVAYASLTPSPPLESPHVASGGAPR